MKQRIRNQNSFTHFISIPLIAQPVKNKLFQLCQDIHKLCDNDPDMKINNPNLFHITISMLCLTKKLEQAKEIFKTNEAQIKQLLQGKIINLNNIGYFQSRERPIIPYQKVSIIYLHVDDESLVEISDFLIRKFIEAEIIDSDDLKSMKLEFNEKTRSFRAMQFHLTLFRVNSQRNFENLFQSYTDYNFGQVPIQEIDISTRFEYDGDQFYKPLIRINV